MPMPYWAPVIGSLGDLNSMTIISRLITEWSQRQGLTPTSKGSNMVLQARNRAALKCDNCSKTSHTKARCWGKGGGQEGQYPEWFKGKKDQHTSNSVQTVTKTPIIFIWTYGSKANRMSGLPIQLQWYMSVHITKTSPITMNTTKTAK